MQQSDLLAGVLASLPSSETIAAFVLGLLFIVLNLKPRFNEIAGEPFPAEFRSFKLSDLTSTRRFRSGMTTYFVLLALIYVLLLKLGPNVVGKVFGIETTSEALPLYVALILAGIVPNVPGIANAEQMVRALAQRIAGVPSDHAFIRKKIAEATLDPATKEDLKTFLAARLPLAEARAVISDRDFKDLLKCVQIVRTLDHVSSEHPMVNHVSLRVSQYFDSKLADGRRKLEAIEDRILAYLEQEPEAAVRRPLDLKVEIRDAYELLTYLLSCAIVAETSARQRAVNEILDEMGFVVTQNVRRFVLDRVLSSILKGTVAVFVTSAAVNAGFILLSPQENAGPARAITWITYSLTFAVPTYVMLLTFCVRRNRLIRDNRWFMSRNGFRPRMSKQVGAALVAIGVTGALVPFIDAVTLIVEVERIDSLAKHFPLDSGAYWRAQLGYLITPCLILVFFAKLIERDRRAEFDPGYAPAYFKRGHVLAYSTVTALTIGLSYLGIVLITSQPLAAAVDAWRTGGLAAFFQHGQTVNIIWFFCAVCAGAFVFFRSFVRSALDIADPQPTFTAVPEPTVPA
jgi:hypothetical protein